eukprot:INCI15235.1.p1 GENE.INCI15235.1~~INCI15235.1.p1  ORF type:complete len:430 (+),score=59.30 INCI15235.1:234-1523(+)
MLRLVVGLVCGWFACAGGGVVAATTAAGWQHGVETEGGRRSAPSPPQTTCKSDLDCSLLGTCSQGSCECRPGWTGTVCARAHVEPLDISHGYQNATTSSWGGRAFQHVEDGEAQWYLMVTEIAKQCPLILFEQNSQVALTRSASKTAAGPYEHLEVVLPPFHHNPTFIGPTPDGMYLMFFIGANNASNVLDCTNGVPPGSHQVQVPSNNWISMAWTTDPVHGQWQQRVILNSTGGNQSAWNCESQNPTAHIMPNGTIVMVYRANNCDRSPATFGEHLGVAVAANWSSEFVRDEDPIVSPQSTLTHGSNNEDAFLWQEGDGSWHFVNHQQGKNIVCGPSPKDERGHSCGAHFFAENPHGPWHMSPDYVYSENVMLSNGSAARFQTRQRPQLIFDDATGAPTFLITSGSFEGNNPDLNMTTHTYFQKFIAS